MVQVDAIHRFIQSRPYLVWYVKDLGRLSEEAIVEATLNYGDWEDFQELIRILGMKEVARVFRGKSRLVSTGRTNYRPEVEHYFTLYFNAHA